MTTTINETTTEQSSQSSQSTQFYETLSLLSRRSATGASPIPSPIPIPIPIPLVFGSRFMIWKQDPTVTDPGVRLTFVPTLVLDGPKDSRITTDLAGTTPVNANSNRSGNSVPAANNSRVYFL